MEKISDNSFIESTSVEKTIDTLLMEEQTLTASIAEAQAALIAVQTKITEAKGLGIKTQEEIAVELKVADEGKVHPLTGVFVEPT